MTNYHTFSTNSFSELYHASITNPSQFWRQQSERIYWHKPLETILDNSKQP